MDDKELIDLSDDFSFTFEEEDDKYQNDSEEYWRRLMLLEDAIKVLLKNLKRDPEKVMIKWPNRLADIEKFEKKIKDIVEGKQ